MKWLLFLNPSDYSHNAGLFWKVTLWILISTCQNYYNITKTKLQKLKHSESGSISSHWKYVLFLTGLQIILAVTAAQRNTMESIHNTRQINFHISG